MNKTIFSLCFFLLFVSGDITQSAELTQVAAGGNYTVVLKNDGSLWAWGGNTYGQLGDETTTPKNSSVKINAADWKQVAAGESHTLAIKTDGTLWAWGFNNPYGQLGDSTRNNQNRPVRIGSDNNWLSLAAGAVHSVAVKTDGTLWAWGANFSGQLGDETTVNRNTPVQIGTAADWKQVAAGESHSLAVRSDGTLWSWGDNTYGQLGDGTTVRRKKPVRVGASSNWQTVAAGASHSLAIKTDGTLWSWGSNEYGQLGDETTKRKKLPVQIGGAASWQSAAAGRSHTVAIKDDRTLWTWGYNEYGQLGDETRTEHSVPVQIGAAANWQSVAAGSYHVAAMKTDGSLWTWGYNKYGQLGDRTTKLKKSPVQISTTIKIGQYIDSRDGTIIDTKNGLMWKRCSEGLSGMNCEEGNVKKHRWFDANRLKNIRYTDYTDWRLPTIDELKTLVYCSTGVNKDIRTCNKDSEKPTINQQAFPNTDFFYWSESMTGTNLEFVWHVNFDSGLSDINFLARAPVANFAVRLVRGEKKIGQYIDNRDSTITDTETGLMWKRCSEGLSGMNCEEGNVKTYGRDDAVKRFKNVKYAGYADWRLPTIDELKTLVDCSNSQIENDRGCNGVSETPTINQQAFPNTMMHFYWSGTPSADYSASAWSVVFFTGSSTIGNRGNHAVRLVRGGQ